MAGVERWGFVTQFRARATPTPRWDPVLPLLGTAYPDSAVRGVQHALAAWDVRLANLGGDPLRAAGFAAEAGARLDELDEAAGKARAATQ